MSTLVEHVVIKQLIEHINSNNFANPQESAYTTGHSTETTLLHIKNKMHSEQNARLDVFSLTSVKKYCIINHLLFVFEAVLEEGIKMKPNMSINFHWISPH